MKNTKQKKQKILYVITKASFGGAQKYVLDLSIYFKSHGHDIVVAHGKNEFKGNNIFVNKLKKANIRTIEILSLGRDVKIFGDIRTLFTLIRIFFKEKPNIIHLNSTKIGLIGGVVARASRAQHIIYTAHGLPFLEDRPKWQNLLIKYATWSTFISAHKVIVLSKLEESLVKKWWFTKNKIYQIYNGIEKPIFLTRTQARKELADKFNLPVTDKTYLIGSIAELTTNKGLLEFLPILQKLKEKHTNFIYIHFGTGELAEELKQKTEKLNLTNNIFWLGFDEQASKYLKALDLFTLPSKKEGLPYVLLEAKMANIKIKARKVGGVPEILNNDISDFEIRNMLVETSKVYGIT